MDYQEKLEFIFNERQRIDGVIEGIVRLNGGGTHLDLGKAAVEIEPKGDVYQLKPGDDSCLVD